MSLEVSVTDLVAAAVAVTGIGEDLASSLVRSEGIVESVSVGWQGDSAAALGVLASRLAGADSVLLGRLRELAGALDSCAQAFAADEQSGARALGAW